MKSLTSIAYKFLTAFMIVMLALTAMPVSPVFAAATPLDTWTNVLAAAPGTATYTATSPNFTVSAGTNRLLMAGFCLETGANATMSAVNVRLDGAAGTVFTLAADTRASSQREHCYLGYLLDAQVAAGNHTLYLSVTVTGSTITDIDAKVGTYQGINQASPIPAGSATANNSGAANVTFGTAVNYFAAGRSVYITANGGTPATITHVGGFTTSQTLTSNGQSSFIGEATNAAAGTYALGSNIAFGGTTSTRSAVAMAALNPAPTAPTITSANNAAFGVGQAGTFTVTATGLPAAMTYSLDPGSDPLPPTITFTNAGVLSGTPTAVGTYNLIIRASNGVNPDAIQNFVLTVGQAPAITSAAATTFTVGSAGSFTITTTGTAYPVPVAANWSAVGLPAWATFNTTTHVLSGNPPSGSIAGSPYGITFNVTTAAGTGTQNFSLVVQKGNQTITFANPPTPAGYGTTYTISPTATSGLPVTVVATGSCTIAGYVVTYNNLGVCTLTASQAGDASYNPAPQVQRTVAVQPAATTITISPSVNPSVLGQNVNFTVRVFAGGVPVTGGTVTITSCEWVVFFCAGGTTQTWGTYTLVGGVVVVSKADLPVERIGGNIVPSRITVTYNPTGNYNGSNTTLDQTVSTASTNVALTSSINPSFYLQSVTFTATVTVSPPGAGSVSGGTVTFYDGATLLCTVANIPGNTAICTTSTLVRGTHNITAHYEGTDQFGTSTSTILAQIVRRDSDIALISSLNPSVYGNTVTFTATVTDPAAAGTPTGTVSFYDDVTLLGTSNLNAGAVATFNTSLLSTGRHNITATYNGDTFYVAGTSLVVVQVVNPATLTVTADPKSTIYGDNNVAFTYTFSGFVNGQTLATSGVTGTADCATTATITSPVGTYPINCTIGSLTSNNYAFTFAAGTLTVTPKALIITADNQGKTYGFTLTFNGTEFNSSGLINSDTVTSVTLTSAGAISTAPNGTYPIVPSAPVGAGLTNYTISYVNGTLTVGGNLLIITANDYVGANAKPYGQPLTLPGTAFTYFLAGGGSLQSGESLDSVTLSSLGTADNAPVGTYPIIPSNAQGTGLNNYVIIYRNGQLDVNPALLTFTPDSHTKIYGNTFNGYSGTFTGLFGFDNITPAYDSPGAPATATVTAPGPSYPINVLFTDPNNRLGNYILTLNTATLTVTKRTLTVTPTNRSKTYGDTLTVADFTGTIAGIQNGDNITATYDSPLGDPATAAVGNYDINAAISAPGGLGNYTLVNNVGTLTVTKRDLIVTSHNQSKIYGDAFSAFTGSVVGLQNGDVVTPTYDSLGAPAAAAVGVYNITVLPLVGDTSNYNLIYNIGTLAVTRRDLVVTPTDRTKIYGDTIIFTAADGTVTGLQAGDAITPVYSSPGAISTATVAGSTYPIIVTLNDPGGKLSNYNYTLNTGTLTVTLRDLTVTSDSKNKQYGTWFFAFTGSITGIQNGENITANYASAGSLPSAAVGGYPITVTPLNDPTGKLGNYNVILNEGTLTVGSSNLTVTADNKTITYGDPEPAFTFTYAGFASGDTPSVIDTPPTCTVAAPHTDFGTYPIVCSGGADNAYTFTYVAGTLTINKRALTVTPTDKTKVYGDLFTAFTGTITGVQGADVFTATYASTGGPVTAAVGTYPITAVLNDPGGRANNYTVTLNTGTLTVATRALTVTPADKTKIYGDVFTLFTGTITGIQNGDAITATYASTGAAATATVAGSPYPITATLNALPAVLANYSIITNQGNLAVTLRPLTVTPDNKSKAFGAVFNAFTGVVVGLQNGDAITPVYDSLGAPAAAASGLYPITVTLTATPAVLANYAVTLNTGTLTVGTNILTVTANNQTIVYGASDPTFTFTYSGFQGGDTAAVLTTEPTCQVLPAHNAVGTFPITCAGGVDDNYIFSYVPATLTVTKRALTVTPDNQTKIYGDVFTAYTGVALGIQGADNITVTYASPGGAATAAVGTYNITATLNDPNNRLAANYTVTLNTNTLVVTPRPLVATPDDKNKVYGALFTAFTGTISGIQNGDAITPVYASTGAPAAMAIGLYPITVTLNATPAVLANYTVTLNTGTLSVGGNFLIVTPADKTKIYGDVFGAFTGTIVGLQPGDIITATYTSTGAVATAGVGNYDITATLVDPGGKLGNYTVIMNTGTLSVTPRTLTVTPDNKAKAFGTVFNAFTGSVVGIQNGDAITETYASTGAGAAAAVGAYPITVTLNATPAVLANYTVTLNTGVLTVGTNILTVTAIDQSIIYGAPDPAFTFTYSGFQGGDTAAVLTTQPTCQVLPAHNAVGTYPISCAGGVDESYIFSYVSATLTVTRRTLIVTPDNKTKVYGDLFTAYTGVTTGIQGADNISATYTSAGGVATATVAGSPYLITATLNDPNNRLANNYTVTLNTGTLTVTQRPLVATPDDKNKVYGVLFTAFTGNVVGIQNGDVITPVYDSLGAPIAAASGTYPITVTLNALPAVLANYSITLNTGTLTVGGNTLVVTPADKTKVYGSTFAAFTGTVVGLQPGDNITATYISTGAAANAIVGNYPITVTLNDPGNKLPNYTVILNTGTLSVTPRDLVVTPDNKAKAFGTNFNAFTGTLAGLQAGDIITPTYASPGAPAAAAAGIYTITVTLADPGNRLPNYNVTINTGTLAVGTNVLTVTANNQTMVYGNADPAFTFTYSGFLGTDTAAVIDTPPTCQVSVIHNAVGTFPITCSGGIDNNYIFSYTPATLTVTSRALTVTPDNKTKVYGDIFTAYTGTSTGIQAADNITITYASVGAAAIAAVGPYQITVTLNDPNNRLANYTQTLNTGALTVTQRPLIATPDDKNKVYGVLFTAYTGSVVGIQNGDGITATYASAGAPVAAASGTYPITATLNDPNNRLANYAVTLNTGTLTVGGNTLVVTPADKTKIYGSTFAAFTGTIVGLQPGDNITATYTSTGAAANAIVGNYPITVTLNDPGNKLPNYTVILNTGTLSVTPRDLVVTPDNKAKAFGTNFNAFTGTLAGLQAGDIITPTYASTGAPAAAAAGIYTITVTLADPGNRLPNYNVTINTGTLAVGTNVLTVTANNQTIVYGNADPAFTFTYSGFLGTDTAAVIDTLPTCQVSVIHNAVGTFPITCSGGIDNNYIFSYTPATLTVTPRALTVTPANKTKVYGDIFTAFTGAVAGLQAADNITVTYNSTGAPATAAVGTYQITVTLNDPNNRLSNYTQTLNTGTLAVTQRPLVVTPDNKNKVYGTLFTAFTGNVVGIQNGDAITPVYASAGAPAAIASGNYPITVTLNALPAVLANYAVTLNTGTLTVGGNTLIVTPADKTKVYGSTFAAFTGTIVGLQPGDNITATYASAGAAANAIVNNYPITVTLNDPGNKLPNYTVTLNTGTLSVTPRTLLVVPDNKVKPSGTLFTAFTGTVTGIQAGDNITVTYASTGAPAAAAAGTYLITATLNDSNNRLPNYVVTISNTSTLTVSLTAQTITVTTPAPVTAANGSTFTVAATASSGLSVAYSSTGSCTNVGATFTMTSAIGACIVHYNQAGDGSYNPAQQVIEAVSAQLNSQTITVTTPAPAVAPNGSTFDVAATASSGLNVSITAAGICTIVDHADGTATVTMVATNGTCEVRYNQAGNGTYAPAPQIIESVAVDSNAPTVTVNQVPSPAQPDPTNASPINFTVVFSELVTGFIDSDVVITGTAGATTATVTEIAPNNGTTYNVAVSGMANDGTVIVSIPAAAAQDSAGNDSVASSSTDNTVTYLDGIGPNVQLVNTALDTGDGKLIENEVVTVRVNQITVKFNQDVFSVQNGDPNFGESVINPNNFMLIRDLGDTAGFQTVSCSAGAVVPADTKIAVNSVVYDKDTFTATLTINSLLSLSNGTYRLFVCGTTSIVDPLNTALKLVGSNGPNTDFVRNFTVNIKGNGGGGGGGGGGNNSGNGGKPAIITTGLLIPVTGFDPNQVTILPKQPVGQAYKSLNDIRIEIPTLGIDFPIVGVPKTNNGWDLTWLENNVGYLEGSAYPTFSGNSVLTAHINDANKNVGPFSDIKGMQLGDKIFIHAYGKVYVYEVQENTKISPTDLSAAFKHEEYAWITLVTCEDYNAKIGEFYHRRMVRAILVSVVPEN